MPFIYYGEHMLVAWCHVPANLTLLASKYENIIPCVMRMKKLLVIWYEEIDIDSDDEMDLGIEGETASEKSSNEMSESDKSCEC
jgi:hypothetical protein